MAKLYFKYGAMGSSKTAQALMCKFNYEQVGFTVTLIKPVIDNRDLDNDKIIVKSRIGLQSTCLAFDSTENLYKFSKIRLFLLIFALYCDTILLKNGSFAINFEKRGFIWSI